MRNQRDAFDRAIAARNAGDLDSYLDLYDESILLYGYSEEPMRKGAVVGFYRGFTILKFRGEQVVARYSIADFSTVVAQIT